MEKDIEKSVFPYLVNNNRNEANMAKFVESADNIADTMNRIRFNINILFRYKHYHIVISGNREINEVFEIYIRYSITIPDYGIIIYISMLFLYKYFLYNRIFMGYYCYFLF